VATWWRHHADGIGCQLCEVWGVLYLDMTLGDDPKGDDKVGYVLVVIWGLTDV
jgi:hypothetical protein